MLSSTLFADDTEDVSSSSEDVQYDYFTKARASTVVERMELFIQDNGIVSCDPLRKQEIQEAEMFIKTLPPLNYMVTKINQWGRHQMRQIRLTSEGIENIRKQQVVSSTYRYTDIITVSLRDVKTFVLQYQQASHDYVYSTPVAVQIVQEISNRIAVHRTVNKKKLTYDIALDYQRKLIEEGGKEEAKQKEQLSVSIGHNSYSSPHMSSLSDSSYSMLSSSDSEIYKREGGGRANANKRATKLLKILGTTVSQRLQNEVNRLILTDYMPEGRTINKYVADFHMLMKSPATVPQNVRMFIDTLRDHILEKRNDTLSKLLVNEDGELDPDAEPINITTVVELCLERSVIVRLQKPIFEAIKMQTRSLDDRLGLRTSQLRYKPQSFYNIPEDLQSPNNWSSAVLELSCINRCETPADKNATILATAKAIYNCAHHDLRGTKREFLSADDFLPIYIFVVINSGVVDLESTSQFLWSLSDPTQLNGESGYYLTVFSSVVNLLKSLDMSKLNTAHTIDELITNESTTSASSEDEEEPNNSDANNDNSSRGSLEAQSPIKKSNSTNTLSTDGLSSHTTNTDDVHPPAGTAATIDNASIAQKCARGINRGLLAVKNTFDASSPNVHRRR